MNKERWYTLFLNSVKKWAVIDSNNPGTFFLFLTDKALAEAVAEDLNKQNETRTSHYSY